MRVARVFWPLLTFALAFSVGLGGVARAQSATVPAAGSYRYHVRQRGFADVSVDVVVTQDSTSDKIVSKESFTTRTMIGTTIGPGNLPVPQFQFDNITTESTYTLAPTLDALSYSTYSRGGAGGFYKVEFGPDGASVNGGIAKSIPVPLGPTTAHFIVFDGWEVATLFVLPSQLNAWKEAQVTAISTGIRPPRGVPYSAIIATPDVRPKSAPLADTMYKLDGPEPVTIWVDPATFVPDYIELPALRTTILRDGLRG